MAADGALLRRHEFASPPHRRGLLAAAALFAAAAPLRALAAPVPPPPQVGDCPDCIGEVRLAAFKPRRSHGRRRLHTEMPGRPPGWHLPSLAKPHPLPPCAQVNETLNACPLDAPSCISTLNDDEPHFAAPWQARRAPCGAEGAAPWQLPTAA